jgi:hypothetical protein
MIAAGGGLIGILVLVITIVVVLKGRDPKGDAEAGGAAMLQGDASGGDVPAASLEQKIREAITQIDKGNYSSGIEALKELGPVAEGREDVHRALLKGYSQTNRPREAMREVGLVMSANPSLNLLEPSGIVLRTEVRDTALLEGQPSADKGAVDEAWSLLNGRLGSIGLDDLYDIAYGRAGVNYPKAAARAKIEVVRADRTKMSPSLAVTADLHAVSGGKPNCSAIKGLLDRAVEKGDERTLLHLRTLVPPRVVATGHWGRVSDALGCIHEGSLSKALTDLEASIRRKK